MPLRAVSQQASPDAFRLSVYQRFELRRSKRRFNEIRKSAISFQRVACKIDINDIENFFTLEILFFFFGYGKSVLGGFLT